MREFASNAEDNPGRGNLYKVQGCEVIVDFAHNEHSMSAMINMVKTMPARRRVVMFGHAGDRSDQEIRDLTYAVADLNADLFVVSEVEKYLRGRQLGDVPQIVKEALVEHTIDKGRVLIVKSPLEGVRKIIAGSEPGDIILLFVLDQREEVHDWLVSQAE